MSVPIARRLAVSFEIVDIRFPFTEPLKTWFTLGRVKRTGPSRQAGDVLWFSSLTVHKALENRSRVARRSTDLRYGDSGEAPLVAL